jgi:adenylate cyclase
MRKIDFLKRHAVRISLGLMLVVLMLLNAVGVMRLEFVERLENYAYDLRLQWTMPGSVDPRIVIVDIDEKSLLQQGHWPWPRNKLAGLIDTLFDQYKIDVLGFDVLFAEHDDSSGLGSLEELVRGELKDDKNFDQALAKLRPRLMYDQLFAQSLKNRRITLGYYFQHDAPPNSPVGSLPPPALAPGSFEVGNVGAAVATGYTANLPELQAAAVSGGFFNASPLIDPDGVLRRFPMLQMYDGALYEGLSLAVARLVLHEPRIELVYEVGTPNAVALESIKLGRRRIPVDADVAALVPFRGKQGSFAYVSASDVLQAKVAPEILRGAIVLMGTTAPGLLDLRTVPIQTSYAGVELHANLIAGILDGNIKERPAYLLGLELLLLLGLGTLLVLALPALSPLNATLLSVVTSLLVLGLNLYFWASQNLVIPLASVLVMAGFLFVLNMSYGFFVDSRGKRQLARLFGQYVPPELVNEMAQDPGAYTLSGSNREMTVLFSDVRGFTTISEGLDPQQLTQLMNDFLTPMTHVIHRHRGTIDKYMGDAIMSFWGAPLSDEQHARHALLAALDMVAELDALQDKFKASGWPPIKVGVGLNSGEMTVGNMGSEFRLAYTVMGDAVNLGSRLEGLTKEYGVHIIVSEYTAAAVPDFAFRELDSVRVKGKDNAVRIFEPIGPSDQLTESEKAVLAQYHAALTQHRAQNWQLAGAEFARLQQLDPERKLYQIYAGRIALFAVQPPAADWDGSHTFMTK